MNPKKKFVSLLICLILTSTFLPSSAFASGTPIPITSSDMTIVAGSTYSIDTYTQLNNFSLLVNGTGGAAAQSCEGATIILTADVSSAHTWQPIGTGSHPFEGTFDGKGHTISTLSLPYSENYVGLFGYIGWQATVKNVNVDGIFDIDGQDVCVGGIVGYNYFGKVQNCTNSCNLLSYAYSHFGGIVGYNYCGTIENCSNLGTVSSAGYARVGGIVGNDVGGLIRNCTNTGVLTSSGSVGGIAGVADSSSIQYCLNYGTITCNDTVASGGIVGNNYSVLDYCVNNGTVTSSVSAHVGGIAGYSNGTIRDCSNTGQVSSDGWSGGIVGFDDGIAQNCYNAGHISHGAYVGGIVAAAASGIIENCYNSGIVDGYSFAHGGVIANNGTTVRNCYWLSGTAQSGIGMGTVGTNIISFSNSGSGVLSAPVTIVGYGATNSLLTALDNWVDSNKGTIFDLALWGTGTDTYTYPIFAQWIQLAGDNRFDTMKAIVGRGFETADTVIIAIGGNYPDALAAAGLAGVEKAPILLTEGTYLSSQAASEITRLGATNAIIVGGESVITPDTAAQIEALVGAGNVTRASGIDRVATALDIFDKGVGWSRTAVIATGFGFADALSISPYAYANGSPVFLTGSDTGSADLSDTTKAVLTTANFDEVVIVGGTGVVSEATQTYLEGIFGAGCVMRLSGDDRYRTSAEIARFAIENGILSYNNMAVATGNNFPDALAGSTLCGSKGAVLLLADDTTSGFYCVDATIADNKAAVYRGFFLGGNSVVTQALQDRIKLASDV